jgi:hypothetical protein
MNYKGGTRSSGYETDATPFVFYLSSVCTSSSLSPRVVCAREIPFVFYPRVSAPPVPSSLSPRVECAREFNRQPIERVNSQCTRAAAGAGRNETGGSISTTA